MQATRDAPCRGVCGRIERRRGPPRSRKLISWTQVGAHTTFRTPFPKSAWNWPKMKWIFRCRSFLAFAWVCHDFHLSCWAKVYNSTQKCRRLINGAHTYEVDIPSDVVPNYQNTNTRKWTDWFGPRIFRAFYRMMQVDWTLWSKGGWTKCLPTYPRRGDCFMHRASPILRGDRNHLEKWSSQC